jgi:RecA/RadA recombinase
MDFLKDIVSQIGGDYVSLASDIEENEVFVDTGSYVFNALVSGSIFGGVSQNKITAIAGSTSTGKTYFALAVIKNFLNENPEGYCLYFDTEAAITKNLLRSRGVDISRVIVINVVTIEEFRTKALKAVDIYLKTPSKNRKPCFFVLDSLGMLSTNKEIGDTLAEKDTKDMTKAALIKGAFRMLTLKLGQAKVPMIVTNHVYDGIGQGNANYTPKVMSGGSALGYSSSTIIELSKSKEKEGNEVIGSIIRAKTMKSRLSKENQETEIRLFYDERGLDRYYGLLQLAEEANLIKRTGNRYEIQGKLLYEKAILKTPETYFTQEFLEKIDLYAQMKFSYGHSKNTFSEEQVEEDLVEQH